VFGPDDELGTLNFQTSEGVLRGVAAVRRGDFYPLNLPANLPTHRPSGRPELSKMPLFVKAEHGDLVGSDDYVVLALQGSTQWDSFVHCGAHENGVDGVFYNGLGTDAISDDGYAYRGGIDKIAQRGIVARGVLLDVARMVAGGSEQKLPDDHVIDEAEALECLQHEGMQVVSGDVICFRTGWVEAYLDADAATREAMYSETHRAAPGISPQLAALAQRQQWSAVTADNSAVDVSPIPQKVDASAHVTMQRNLGLPFGELFCFRNLAAACAEDRRWDFLFVAVPLWVPGGLGSPGNAIAIR
jgi:kynurenine formamidase